jgi:hypothetical protein
MHLSDHVSQIENSRYPPTQFRTPFVTGQGTRPADRRVQPVYPVFKEKRRVREMNMIA